MINLFKKHSVILIFSGFLLLLSNSVVAAIEPPDKFLDRVTDKMIASLNHHEREIQSRPEKLLQIIDEILVPHIDSISMAKWVAGKQVWVNTPRATRLRFANEFRDLLIRSYASTLLSYDDQVIQFYPVRGGYDKKRVQVNSVIRESGKDPIKVSFRLLNRTNTWKVYDISIEGVSLLKGFKAQFSKDIQHNGIESVTARIQEHNKKPFK